MRVASTDGVELEVHQFGGTGPPLIIAHATGFCAGPYRPLAGLLAPHFTVWAIDFRGHGDSSSAFDGAVDWKGAAADLLAALDAVGDEPFFAVGHSMGGAAVLMAAVQRPERFRALFVYEPIVPPRAGGIPTEGDDHLAGGARRRRSSFPDRPTALARYASRPPLSVFRADALAAYVEYGFRDDVDGSISLKCSPETEARTFEGAGDFGADQLGELLIPTLVACGATDRGTPPELFARPVADSLPLGRLVEYAHLGHFGPFQDPVTIANDIVAFTEDPQ